MDINQEKQAYSDWYAYTHETWMTDEQKQQKKLKQEWEEKTAKQIAEILERNRNDATKRHY